MDDNKSIIKSEQELVKDEERHIVFLLDETGSMSVRRGQTIDGFNEFLKSLRREEIKPKFTFTKFNSAYISHLYVMEDLDKVEFLSEETYRPTMLTPLYDAIGKTIDKTEAEIKGKILFVIMTDGEENASVEFSRDKIFELIKQKEAKGWGFMFLGSDVNVWSEGVKLGIKGSYVYDPDQMRQAYCGMAQSASHYYDTGKIRFQQDKEKKEED